ncbi:DUF563 domain-containing protein, partial [Brevundimonas naejangsanensis]|uniref:DUF563 domain-containing protein n=1 Tax=Brevundimonas naejangsanensis TaxID=588932 RepID=UPI0034D783B0
ATSSRSKNAPTERCSPMLSARETTLEELARAQQSTYFRYRLQDVPFRWTSGTYDYAKLGNELTILSNVQVVDVFHLYAPDQNIFVSDVSYENSLNTWGVPHTRTSSSVKIDRVRPLRRIPEPVFVLGGHNNHYHWIMNWLPRLLVYDKLKTLVPQLAYCKFLVHADISDAHLESLAALGIGPERIIKKGGSEWIHLDCAIVPSFFSSNCYYDDVFIFLKEKFGSYRKPCDGSRIYVSRQNIKTPRRRVINQEELDLVFHKHGVKTVVLEEMSFIDQIAAFSAAEVVVGPHGAGLANMVFSSRSSKLLLFEYKKRSEYALLCDKLGISCNMLVCNQHIDAPYERDNPAFQDRLRDLIVDCSLVDRILSD